MPTANKPIVITPAPAGGARSNHAVRQVGTTITAPPRSAHGGSWGCKPKQLPSVHITASTHLCPAQCSLHLQPKEVTATGCQARRCEPVIRSHPTRQDTAHTSNSIRPGICHRNVGNSRHVAPPFRWLGDCLLGKNHNGKLGRASNHPATTWLAPGMLYLSML
jgi:hypothetical protein